ncbi:hypothetical protein HGRIS_010191 [Hohenbuehelia grisea]|uniref:Uncharacterized protein n=1 Tax=Hohenbuehelia grisea TaxID=104357 RepID=A0ABR3J3J9_9AGAR
MVEVAILDSKCHLGLYKPKEGVTNCIDAVIGALGIPNIVHLFIPGTVDSLYKLAVGGASDFLADILGKVGDTIHVYLDDYPTARFRSIRQVRDGPASVWISRELVYAVDKTPSASLSAALITAILHGLSHYITISLDRERRTFQPRTSWNLHISDCYVVDTGRENESQEEIKYEQGYRLEGMLWGGIWSLLYPPSHAKGVEYEDVCASALEVVVDISQSQFLAKEKSEAPSAETQSQGTLYLLDDDEIWAAIRALKDSDANRTLPLFAITYLERLADTSLAEYACYRATARAAVDHTRPSSLAGKTATLNEYAFSDELGQRNPSRTEEDDIPFYLNKDTTGQTHLL